jgi:hypothetical protein
MTLFLNICPMTSRNYKKGDAEIILPGHSYENALGD